MPHNTRNEPQEPFSDELVKLLVYEHQTHTLPGLERLWAYYRNELDFSGDGTHRRYAAGQERGLPARLVGTERADAGRSREVVVENDIAWRIQTMVDFMFPPPGVTVEPLAPDPGRGREIKRVLDEAFDGAGGAVFFQNLALLGAVYGFVDVVVRGGEGGVALDIVEAPRAIPVLDPGDYRRLVGYILNYTQTLNEVEHGSFLARLVDRGGLRRGRQATVEVTEAWTPRGVKVWRDGELVSDEPNALNLLPVVHIQNLPQPLFYEGLSEVEPLIPLQDELNTRLSDRANRVTLQSFKMYLGKGVEGFTQRPVGPGQMWMTENPDASIEAFGGDAHSPSEESHINEIREAMDKTSGVSPLAAGVLRSRVGNLTSENALRVTLMGLLAKTQRKRITYGKGIERLCRLVLHTLDAAGVFRTTEDERRVCLHWPSPLPENTEQRLKEAALKLRVGVPRDKVLHELGYEC